MRLFSAAAVVLVVFSLCAPLIAQDGVRAPRPGEKPFKPKGGDGGPDDYRTLGQRWSTTATNGGGLGQGDPTTITWSIVPDGTSVPSGVGEPAGISSLINWLDGVYHGGGSPGGADLTQRTWWGLMNQTFQRFEALGGVTYNYEAADDGVPLFTNPGILGTRGDVRISAKFIDGNNGVLGYNFSPNNGDMVLEANDSFFNNTNNNSRRLRNVFAHEHGHGLGFAHVIPTNQTKLMEPFISTAYDGPQFDDILNLHRKYGDFYEKSNAGAGNENHNNAIALGLVANGSSKEIGADGLGLTSSLLSSSTDTDFISVDDNGDVDYLSFEINNQALVDLVLTPVGPTYDEGPQFGTPSTYTTSQFSDLPLTLFDTNGTSQLAISNSAGLGGAESISENLVAGTYFARVTGAHNEVQMYHLSISASAVPEPGAAGLLALAGAGLVSIRRRRRS